MGTKFTDFNTMGTNYCLWKSYPAFKKRTTDEAPILDQHTHLIR